MKKKFKFSQAVAGPDFAYKAGDEVFLDSDQAKNWELCGYGSIVAEKAEK